MLRLHKEGNFSIFLTLTLVMMLNIPIWLFVSNVILQLILAGLTLALLVLILQFFRNPDRSLAATDETIIYAPADGKIVVIEETQENEFFKDKRIQISIFMSPLNVHVNRNPVSGTVKYVQHHHGKYLAAWNPKSSTENERTTTVYEASNGRTILIRQIAGALAKRIVNYLKAGDSVTQGQDMGFIKLGSRVDIFVPLGTKIEVKLGNISRGNRTILARW